MERNEVFYDWLRAKFFEFEDNDTRVQQLSAAVNELADGLKNRPQEVRCYTLAALDSNIPVNNSAITSAYELVKKHWSSVEGKYAEPPRGILRGVILSALYQIGTDNDELCRIIYYTASGYSQLVSFGNEQLIIGRILFEFGTAVEDKALAEWALEDNPLTTAFKPFKVKDLKMGDAKVDKDTLKGSLTVGLESYPDRSDYTSRSWIPTFIDKASNSIAEAVEEAVQGFGQSFSMTGLETEINKFFAGVTNTLSDAFNKSFRSLLAVERRSKLLWWKETLYSTTLRKGYREIDSAILPVLMAIDLAKLLPNVIPVSVDYLLKDTYREVRGDVPNKQTLADLLACFEDEKNQHLLMPYLPSLLDCDDRTTLTSFIIQLVKDQKSLGKFDTSTGLRLNVEILPEQLAVIVLHDLITERLIQKTNAT